MSARSHTSVLKNVISSLPSLMSPSQYFSSSLFCFLFSSFTRSAGGWEGSSSRKMIRCILCSRQRTKTVVCTQTGSTFPPSVGSWRLLGAETCWILVRQRHGHQLYRPLHVRSHCTGWSTWFEPLQLSISHNVHVRSTVCLPPGHSCNSHSIHLPQRWARLHDRHSALLATCLPPGLAVVCST